MSMGIVKGVTDIDIGVGRYGLRTFKPAIVRGLPHLVSVSQDAIPNVDPRFDIKPEWRELMPATHPVSWEDGTCKAVCVKYRYHPNRHKEPWSVAVEIDEDDIHEPPDKKCGCGIYALDDLRNLHQEYMKEARVIVAVISASGRTVECTNGFRTAFARVVAYWVLDHEETCTCELCGNKLTQERRVLGSHDTQAWLKAVEPREWERFPWLECCEAQFKRAKRWDRPEEMAEGFGLKASPVAIAVKLGTERKGSKTYIDMRDFLSRPAGTQGHFTFDIPV